MPTITLNREVFENLVGKKLPLEKLKDRISMLGTDLESVDDKQIIVEVFPDRPDMLSEQGFARAFSSFIGHKTGLLEYKSKSSNERVIIDSSVKSVRPYTVCAIVKNLKLDDEKIREIIQIQEKLHITYGRHRKKCAIGIYPMEKIKFPIHYLAELPSKIKFQPLESSKVMSAKQILDEHPRGKEYSHLLNGFEKYPIFTDDNGNILSMPPVINSHTVGKVSTVTKDVFIECSGYSIDVLSKCLNMIVTSLADMGGEIYTLELCYAKEKMITPDLSSTKLKIDLEYTNKRLGLNLTSAKLKELLEKMGYGYSNGVVSVPSYRSDILHECDIVEDVAKAYGYENFEEIIPNVSTVGEESRQDKIISKIADILIGLGLIEVNTFHLTNSEKSNKLMKSNTHLIKLANSLTTDYDSLRNNLLSNLMKILSENKHNELPQKIFEISTVFKHSGYDKHDKSNKSDKDSKNAKNDVVSEMETGIAESESLAISITNSNVNFTDMKQILDVLFNSLSLEYRLEEIMSDSFIEGRVARVKVGNVDLGYFGELHPQVILNWALENPVVALELNVTELIKLL